MARVRTELVVSELSRLGWSRAKLSRRADLSSVTVDKIMNGVTQDPGLKTIEAIARALGLKVTDIILDEDDDEEPRTLHMRRLAGKPS